MYTAFLHSAKRSGYSMDMQYDKDVLAVEYKNFTTEIMNAYIFYDLDALPKAPLEDIKLKNCLLVRLI